MSNVIDLSKHHFTVFSKRVCLLLNTVNAVQVVGPLVLRVSLSDGRLQHVSLESLWPLYRHGRDYPEKYIQRHLEAQLLQNQDDRRLRAGDVSRIYPVVQNNRFVHALRRRKPLFGVANYPVIFEPFIMNLWLCYAVQRGERLQYFDEKQLKTQLRLNKPALHHTAMSNLSLNQSDSVELTPLAERLWCITNASAYGNNACALLMPQIWERLIAEQGINRLMVAAPSFDQLLVCDGHDRAALEQLNQRARSLYEGASEGLSKSVFKWHESKKGRQWIC